MALLEQFANDKYKLLQFLSEHQVNPAGHYYIPLSQQEIADGIFNDSSAEFLEIFDSGESL